MEMKYLYAKQELSKLIVFNINDVKLLDPNFNKTQLQLWIEKGYIQRLKRNKFMFSDLEICETNLYQIANKIYSPSYISMEAALSFYGLIPETVFSLSSCSTKKTERFENHLGVFTYQTLSKRLFWGYKYVEGYAIADVEKCLIDYFYLNKSFNAVSDFSEFRFNYFKFTEIYNENILKLYLNMFDNLTLTQRINNFIDYYKNVEY